MIWRRRPESNATHLESLRLIAPAGIVCTHGASLLALLVAPSVYDLCGFLDLFFIISSHETAGFSRFAKHRVAGPVPLHWARFRPKLR